MRIVDIARFGFARGAPALANFLTVSILLRAIGTMGYGRYASVVASASILSVVLGQWVSRVMLRYAVSKDADDVASVRASLHLFIISMTITGAASIALLPFFGSFLFLCWLTGLGISVKELVLESQRSAMRVGGYTATTVTDALVTLAIAWGVGKFHVDYRYFAIGSATSSVLASVPGFVKLIRMVGRPKFDRDGLKKALGYAIPLSLSSLAGLLLFSGSRFVILSIAGAETLGLYTAVYDITQRSLVVVMQIVNLSFYSRIQKHWLRKELGTVNVLWRELAVLYVVIFCVAVDLSLIDGAYIVPIFFGKQFPLVPTLRLATLCGVFLNRWRSFLLEIPFNLTGETGIVLKNAVVFNVLGLAIIAAIVTLGFGAEGAAVGIAIAYLLSAIGLAVRGQELLELPSIIGDVALTTVAGAIGAALLYLSSRLMPTSTNFVVLRWLVFGGAFTAIVAKGILPRIQRLSVGS